MTATLQLQLPLDPRRDELDEPEIVAVEARIADADELRAALPAPRCRCGPRAWGERGHCVRCGRDTTERGATDDRAV